MKDSIQYLRSRCPRIGLLLFILVFVWMVREFHVTMPVFAQATTCQPSKTCKTCSSFIKVIRTSKGAPSLNADTVHQIAAVTVSQKILRCAFYNQERVSTCTTVFVIVGTPVGPAPSLYQGEPRSGYDTILHGYRVKSCDCEPRFRGKPCETPVAP